MTKTKLKPTSVFFEIMRRDDATRTIEAYAFVNEMVDGEGGIALKRQAMIDATPDYMKWANIRKMHQNEAVGVARSVDWDAKGAKMVLEVVDDAEWIKCQRGVYKGLSVKVAPVLMRGKDVIKCKWVETSLVDRPKDPDAVFVALRAEDAVDEYEVDTEEVQLENVEESFNDALARLGPELVRRFVEEEEDSIIAINNHLEFLRGITSAEAPSRENLEGGVRHYPCKEDADGCCGHTTEGGAQECRERQDKYEKSGDAEQIDHHKKELRKLRDKMRAEGIEIPEYDDSRLADENTVLLTRAETAEAEIEVVRLELVTRDGELEAAKKEIKRLEEEPAPLTRKEAPVRFFNTFDREFAVNRNSVNTEAASLAAEFKRLEATAKDLPEKERMQAVTRMMVIRTALSQEHGLTVE